MKPKYPCSICGKKYRKLHAHQFCWNCYNKRFTKMPNFERLDVITKRSLEKLDKIRVVPNHCQLHVPKLFIGRKVKITLVEDEDA